MCGIFAYIGPDNHSVIKAIRGLKDLEYRGYDSWGVAVKTPEGIYNKKSVGKISDIKENEFNGILGSLVIGHTRWATHGAVLPRNAHPHLNTDESIAVVHNGIVENHQSIREELQEKLSGCVFRSDTDTEVLPYLIELYMREGLSFEDAFRETCRRLKGRFAFVALHNDSPFILAARNGSPLVVGKGDGEYFIASDTPAFLDYTRIAHYVDNGEYLKADTHGVSYANYESGKRVPKKDTEVVWAKAEATKSGWEHYMLKEIIEQGEKLSYALEQDDAAIKKTIELLTRPKVYISGAGTASHVSMIAEYFFSEIANKEIHFTPAAEFQKIEPFLNPKSTLITVTQSGETADLLEAIEIAKKKKVKILSVLNVRGSSVERESDHFLPINVGPEIAVASTKAATGQLIVLLLLAYAVAGKAKEGRKELEKCVKIIGGWLNQKLLMEIKEIAAVIKSNEHLFVIGKDAHYPVAREAALKIKEVSYIHAEGFASGELKHGPIALIEEGTPCISIAPPDEWKDDVLSNTEELKARGAQIIGLSSERSKLFDYWIRVPDIGTANPIAYMIATHILAYYLSILRGINPDKPRNLAKSVTVK